MMHLTTDAKKPSKGAAYELIVDMKTKRRELYESDIDSLLLYFAPPIPAKAKAAAQWVARACAKKDLRESLRYIYVADGTMYGSDGARLHRAATDWENGYYCPKTFARVECSLRAQDFERVINAYTKSAPDLVTSISEMPKAVDSGTTIRLTPTRACGFDEKMLMDAVNRDEGEAIKIKTSSLASAYGETEFGQFLVMSRRIK